jgi:hypothetical protein
MLFKPFHQQELIENNMWLVEGCIHYYPYTINLQDKAWNL